MPVGQPGRVGLVSLATGVVVFVAGFGVLGLMWEAYPKDTGLRGWDSYYAATLGDGIFLPLLAASAVALVLLSRATGGGVRTAAAAAAVLGAVIGVLIQESWLADNDIALNWTIPEPHCFNAAGVYHAVFFCAMCAATGLFVVWYLASKRRLRNSPYEPAEGVATFCFWLAAAGFLMMHALDDWTGIFGSTVATVAAMTVACMVGSMILSAILNVGSGLLAAVMSQDLLMSWSGVALAFSFSVVATGAIVLQEDAFFCIGMALLCSFFAAIGFRYTRWVPVDIVAFIALGLAGAMALDLQVGLGTYALSCVAFALVLFAAFAIRVSCVAGVRLATRRIDANWAVLNALPAGILRVFLPGVTPLVASAMLFWIECRQSAGSATTIAGSDVIGFLLYVLMLGLTAMNCFEIFKSVIESERTDFRDNSGLVSVTQAYTYLILSLIAVGAFLVLLIVLMRLFAVADAHAFGMAGWGLEVFLGMRWVVLAVDGVCMVLLVAGAISHRLPFRLGLTLIAVCYLLTAIYVGGLRLPVLVHPLQSLLLFPLMGSVLYMVDAIVSDCSLIRGVFPDGRLKAIAAVVGVGISAVFVLAVLPTAGSDGILPPTLFFPLVGLVGLFVAFTLIPFAGVLLIQDTWSFPSVQVTANTPLLSIIQTGSMGWIIAVFSGLVPSYYLAVANFDAIGIVGFLVILCTVSAVVFRPLENNADNLEDCRKRAREAVACVSGIAVAEETAVFQLRELRWHLERQAFAIMLATFPGSLAALIGMWVSDGWGGSGRRASNESFRDRALEKYLLHLPWPQKALTRDGRGFNESQDDTA